MLKRISAGLAAGAALSSLAVLPVQAEINTRSTVRWNSGGAVYTTKLADFQEFLETGEIDYSTNRALVSGINNSGWTAEEIRKGLSKQYKVNVVYVARFLYSKKGYKFLENQTKSYFPYWGMKKTAVQALRSAIVLDSVDGKLSSAGIMKMLPVDMRLADTCGTFDGAQNVCAKASAKATSSAPPCCPGMCSCPLACRPTRSRTRLPPAPCAASGDQLINRKVLLKTPAIGGGFFMA